MAWGNAGRDHYVYGAGSWSVYYWNSSYNPGASFDYCMANCTTFAYGRVRENGLPRPITAFPDANLWHNYVNTADDWELINYTSNMQLQAGDIVEWEVNHVAVVETSGTNPYVSGSWYTGDDKTGSSNRTTAVMGSTLASVSAWMVANVPNRFYHYVTLSDENANAGGHASPKYVIRYNGSGPTPPTPTTTPEITISPTYYSRTMESGVDYLDFQYTIRITGIPDGYTVSGGNTYPGLSRVQNSGWSYVDYTVSGVVYRQATKTQTLRYTRESTGAYTTTKYMYYNLTFPNGSINSTTPMYITVQASGDDPDLLVLAERILRRKKKSFTLHHRY